MYTIMENTTQKYQTLLNHLTYLERSKAWLCRKIGISQSLMTLMLKGERTFKERYKDDIAVILATPKEILFPNE